MKQLLFTMLCLLSSVAYGQIVVDPEYGQYQPVEYRLNAIENAQALWEVKPLDGQKEFTSKEYAQSVFAFWGEPGRYALEATVVIVDFESKTFQIKKHNAVFKIRGPLSPPPGPPVPPGPGPTPPGPVPPPPSPSPSIPPDSFNNLGQRLDAVCDQIGLQVDLRNRVSEVYATASTRMTQSGQFYTITEVRNWIETELKQLGLDASWQPTVALIQEDAKSRGSMSWEAAYLWYRAVATGYKGSPLPSLVTPTLSATSRKQTVVTSTTLCPTGTCPLVQGTYNVR